MTGVIYRRHLGGQRPEMLVLAFGDPGRGAGYRLEFQQDPLVPSPAPRGSGEPFDDPHEGRSYA